MPARRLLAAGTFLLVAFVGFTLFRTRIAETADADAAQFASGIAQAIGSPLLNLFEYLGSPSVTAAWAAILASALFVRHRPGAATLVILTMLVAGAVELALRLRFDVAFDRGFSVLFRPEHNHLFWSGYPSGHVLRVVLLTTLTGLLLLPPDMRVAAVVFGAVLGLLTAAQRVHAGQHTGTEVAAALLLAYGLLAVGVALLQLFEARSPARPGDQVAD